MAGQGTRNAFCGVSARGGTFLLSIAARRKGGLMPYYETACYWNPGTGGKKNEDSLAVAQARVRKREAAFLAVCDGIGGLEEGETASGFVAGQMSAWFWESALPLFRKKRWRKRAAQSALRELSRLQGAMEGYERQEGIRCGTTCTMVLVCGPRYLLLHTGDSGAYLVHAPGSRFRGLRELKLTEDHVSQGKLCRCMGDFGFQRPDVHFGRMSRGSALLLCTDGFSRGAPEGFFADWLFADRPAGERHSSDRPAGERHSSDRPAGERGAPDWPAGKRLAGERRPFAGHIPDHGRACWEGRLERIGTFRMACGEKDNLSAAVIWRGKGGRKGGK